MTIIPLALSLGKAHLNETPPAPDWFEQAVGTKPDAVYLNVQDKNIHCRIWNDAPDAPGLLFVHGHAAHARWWDFIAPSFADNYRVAAMDMSGNGDSDHRDKYSAGQFAEEIAQVSKTLSPNTTVVAHSFGGSMARIAAHYYPESLKALVLVDSVISPTRRETKVPEPVPAPRERLYDSLEKAAKRFRLRPPQPRPAAYIQDYIARHSVKQISPASYVFKLDTQVFEKMWPEATKLPDGVTMVKSLRVPCAYIYGKQSRFCPPEVIPMLEELFSNDRLMGIDDAYHHVFLDQPLRFIEALKTTLGRLS